MESSSDDNNKPFILDGDKLDGEVEEVGDVFEDDDKVATEVKIGKEGEVWWEIELDEEEAGREVDEDDINGWVSGSTVVFESESAPSYLSNSLYTTPTQQ